MNEDFERHSRMSEEEMKESYVILEELCSEEDLEKLELWILLHRINSTNSNKKGKNFEPMLTLKRAHKLKDNKVFE